MQASNRSYAIFIFLLAASNISTWWINTNHDTQQHATTQRGLGSGWDGNEQQQRHQRVAIISENRKSKKSPANTNNTSTVPSTTTITKQPFTVDILSVGSINRLDYLHSQQRTFGSHTSVRNFFNVTEVDDADPNCHMDLTWDHVKAVSDYCVEKRKHYWRSMRPIFRSLLGEYAKVKWLENKHDPVGWMCAQPRPYAGLRKAFMHYNMTGQALPDYFIVMDDDTYYNMEWFQATMEALDVSSRDTCYAGCLIRYPIHQVNFTIPYGGFGTIIGEGVLRNMFQSIHCSSEVGEDSPYDVCNRLKENNVEELQYFTNGMNLVELMYKYTSVDMYRNVAKWGNYTIGDGFCMHSDWVIGYFMNFYNMSRHAADPFYRDVPFSRMEAFQGSETYGRKKSGFCRQDRIRKGVKKVCEHGSEICHRVSPEWMELEFQSASK